MYLLVINCRHILLSSRVCALRLLTPTPLCANPRRRKLRWKTMAQRPSRARLVGREATPLPGVEAEGSRARHVLRKNPAMSRWETGRGPRVQCPRQTLRTRLLTPIGNVSRGEQVTAQLGVMPLSGERSRRRRRHRRSSSR